MEAGGRRYMAKFVAEHLGPTLKATHPEIKIFGFDHNKARAAAEGGRRQEKRGGGRIHPRAVIRTTSPSGRTGCTRTRPRRTTSPAWPLRWYGAPVTGD